MANKIKNIKLGNVKYDIYDNTALHQGDAVGSVSSVVGLTGDVTVASIATALATAGYKLTDTDTNTWQAANSSQVGYVPASTANKILRADGDGVLYWGNDSNTTYTLAGLMGSSAKGGTTQPIYWNGSAFKNTTYTLGKNVPSDALFTDTWRKVQLNGTDKLGTGINTNPLNIKAGNNVTITESDGTFTFAATDTTYTSKKAASGGTDVSLVTTGEKYAWNQKQDAITFNSTYNASTNKAATMRDITKANVGLGNVTNDAQIPLSQKGSANGVAELDANGKVPSSQLPSYVDDVIEGYYYNSKFYKESTHTTEIAGESGKIYTDLSTDTTYRWSGTAFVQIKGDLVLGETSSTAYRGDRGKIAYDHSQSTHAPSDANKFDLRYASSKLTKTVNGSATDVVSASTIVTDGGGIKEVKAAAGSNIGSVGTPSVTASTSGNKTTLTFNYLKGAKGDNGSNGTNGTSAAWFTGTAMSGTGKKSVTISGAKAGDMYLNTSTYDVYLASSASSWTYQCNIKGAAGSNGTNGTNGTNGVSCTHSWNGTTLTVTSASGTSSANLKGASGTNGTSAGFGTPTATVDANVGTPSVTITSSGPNTAKVFNFAFKNLKGQPGTNGTKGTNGTNGTSAYWFTGTAVTGTGTSISATVSNSKAGDMYLNSSTQNVYIATAANKWNYVCNIKGATGSKGTNGTNGVSCTHSWSGTTLTVTSASGTSSANLKGDKGDTGTTPTIAAAAGSNIGTVGTPSVTASTSGTTTTFTFNYLKGAKGEPGQNATTTSVFSASANGLAPAASSNNKTGAESSQGNYYLCADGKYRQLPANAFNYRSLGTGANDACAGNDRRLSNSRPASDVYSWAKARTKPTYIMNEVANISVSAITSNTSSSCTITGSSNAGKSQTIIYTNSSGSDRTVTVPTTYRTPDGAAIELTCANGGYCEVNYLNVGGTIYARGL